MIIRNPIFFSAARQSFYILRINILTAKDKHIKYDFLLTVIRREISMNHLFKKTPVLMLVSIFLITSLIVPAVEARMIGTSIYMEQQNSSARTDLQSFLAREDVREQMIELGVNPDDAANRVATLTDQEISELQKHINDLPAGSNIFALLGIVLVFLIVLELVGVTDVFSQI